MLSSVSDLVTWLVHRHLRLSLEQEECTGKHSGGRIWGLGSLKSGLAFGVQAHLVEDQSEGCLPGREGTVLGHWCVAATSLSGCSLCILTSLLTAI